MIKSERTRIGALPVEMIHHGPKRGLDIARQARTAVTGVDMVRVQTDQLDGIARINDSGVRILHAARALRKVAVGK